MAMNCPTCGNVGYVPSTMINPNGGSWPGRSQCTTCRGESAKASAPEYDRTRRLDAMVAALMANMKCQIPDFDTRIPAPLGVSPAYTMAFPPFIERVTATAAAILRAIDAEVAKPPA